MKNLLSIILLFSFIGANAQFSQQCFSDIESYGLDTNDFDGVKTGHFQIAIDTADTTNIWAVGAVSKPGFPAAYNGVNAIQTDTALPYAPGINTAFYVWRDTAAIGWPGYITPFSISFWQYHDVDTLLDSCIVQYTLDSGATWKDIDLLLTSDGQQFTAEIGMNYQGSLSNTPADPQITKKLLFTGRSGGWVREQICFTLYLPKSTSVIDGDFGYRFLFKSDTIDNNKPGWMIDNIQLIGPLFVAGLDNDVHSNPLSIFPNPSATGVYTISYPSNYVTGTLAVYDVFGRKVQEMPLAKTIDLSALPAGTYLYRAQFSKHDRVYSGKLIRE